MKPPRLKWARREGVLSCWLSALWFSVYFSGCSESTDTKATALDTISSTSLGFSTLVCIKSASVSFPEASPGLPLWDLFATYFGRALLRCLHTSPFVLKVTALLAVWGLVFSSLHSSYKNSSLVFILLASIRKKRIQMLLLNYLYVEILYLL